MFKFYLKLLYIGCKLLKFLCTLCNLLVMLASCWGHADIAEWYQLLDNRYKQFRHGQLVHNGLLTNETDNFPYSVSFAMKLIMSNFIL